MTDKKNYQFPKICESVLSIEKVLTFHFNYLFKYFDEKYILLY